MPTDILESNGTRVSLPIKILIFIGAILCFEPGLFDKHPLLIVFDKIYNYGMVLICILLLICYLKRKHAKIDKILLTISIYAGVTLFSTLFSDGEIKSWIFDITTILMAFLLVRLCLDESIKFTINIFFTVILLVSSINLLSILLYPRGIIQVAVDDMYTLQGVWFMGTENQLPPLLIVLTTLSLIKFINGWGPRLISGLAIVMCSFEVYFSTSATGFVGLALVLLFSILYIAIGWFKNAKTPIVLFVCVMILFALMVIIGSFDFLQVIIVNLLKKNMTLTTRTEIWKRAIDVIIEKPILGYGRCSSEITKMLLGHSHAHDEYLNIAFYYGISGLIVWLYLIGKSVRIASKKWQRKEIPLLFFCFFSYMIMFVAEVFGNNYISGFYLVLFSILFITHSNRNSAERSLHEQ